MQGLHDATEIIVNGNNNANALWGRLATQGAEQERGEARRYFFGWA